jgi:EspG family
VNAQSLLVGADRFGFTVNPVELSVLGRAFGVRSRLFPLRLGETTVDPARYALVARVVDDMLERRGLSESGRLHPPVRTAFELLADHRVTVSISGPDELTGLAVSDGVQAMTITQGTDGVLSFALFPADELVGAVVGVLPRVRAAAGTPVMVGAHGASDPAGTRRLAEELAGPRVGDGLLIAEGRGQRGRWTNTLGWVDTESGRYLVHTVIDRLGVFSARYQPAGPAELAAAVTELLAVAR